MGGGEGGGWIRDNRMWKGYSGQKRKEWQVGVLKGWEAGEIEGSYATMLNILQLKRDTGRRRKPRKKGWELVMQGTGARRFRLPPVPHPLHHNT